MDSRSTPYRSEVVNWSPEKLADYFKRLNFRDCEKVVKKHSITGQRFLNMSENDIQKFPKLRVPHGLQNCELYCVFCLYGKPDVQLSYLLPLETCKPFDLPMSEGGGESSNSVPEHPFVHLLLQQYVQDILLFTKDTLLNLIISKLSQEINRHEERKSFFPKRLQTQKVPENTEYRQEEVDVWSSFEESDDYESPDDEDLEDGIDYATPNDGGHDFENDADYEPPPSNDDDAHRNVIFPSKSMPATSEYIDRPLTERSKAPLQPPVPPQRPGSSPAPPVSRDRDTRQPPFLPPGSNIEGNRDKIIQPFKPPSIDRSKKPPLDRSGPPFDRDLLGAGKRPYPEMSLTPQLRALGAELAKIQKPPVPSTERCERNNPPSGRKLPPTKNNQLSERKAEMNEDSAPQRPIPQPNFNTFPSRSKLQSKQNPLVPRSTPDTNIESAVASSVSLPPHFKSSSISRTFSKGLADGRPRLPTPNRQTIQYPKAEKEEVEHCQKGLVNQKWYAADITRPEAEVALRSINKDGTYLVRDSSRKTLEQPFVLMVLYNNKVYNIQIRYRQEHNVYFLGTRMEANEEFTSVAEIIDNFQRTPLLLIDGKDRCSRKQCMLSFPAGYH